MNGNINAGAIRKKGGCVQGERTINTFEIPIFIRDPITFLLVSDGAIILNSNAQLTKALKEA